MVTPTETIIISEVESAATNTSTMVIKIKPTVAKHNVLRELLAHIRHEYPGVWYSFLSEVASKPRTESPKMEGKKNGAT